LYMKLKSGGLLSIGLALGVGLSGCGGGESVGEALGYAQSGPDEMTVIKRPPLTVPPDFNLRPPRPNEPQSNADAASNAARNTLIGPSSEVAPKTSNDVKTALVKASPSVNGADDAAEVPSEATAVEQRYQKSPPIIPAEEQAAEAPADEPPSAGQTALLSRTNRVERDLDALTETRSQNRIDGALLRRLLAWQPTPAATKGETGEEEADATPKQVVQIVRRERTPIESDNNLE